MRGRTTVSKECEEAFGNLSMEVDAQSGIKHIEVHKSQWLMFNGAFIAQGVLSEI